MIVGHVNGAREAIIQIAIVGDNKRLRSVKAIIDTGFSGYLTLPRDLVEALDFPLIGMQEVILGDGSMQNLTTCIGSLVWDGAMRRVEITLSETGSLVGMGMLEGFKLEIEGVVGGDVRITALSMNVAA